MIFNKRNLLFGLNIASSEISKKGYAIMVEGYMDAISVASAGIKNVVASLGTAFTEEQAKLLMRYTRKIYFCYDSDEAGQRAIMRAIPIATRHGAQCKVISMPDCKDPDEYITKYGVDDFKGLIENAESIVDYRLRQIMQTTDYSTIEGKVEAVRQMLPVLANLSNEPVLQNEYCKRVAAALIINLNILNEELNKYLKSPKLQQEQLDFMQPQKYMSKSPTVHDIKSKQETLYMEPADLSESPELAESSISIDTSEASKKLNFSNTKVQAVWEAGRFILKLAWKDTDTLEYSISKVPKEAFPKLQQEIIEYIRHCVANGEALSDTGAAQYLSEQALTELSKILIKNELDEETFMNCYTESINTMEIKWLQAQKMLLMRQIAQITNDNSDYIQNNDFISIMDEANKIKHQIARLMRKS